MARAPRYDPWKGRTSKELLDMSPTQIGNLSTRELRALVTKLSSAANKRVRNLEKLTFESPALKEVRKEGGRFTGKGKSDSQLAMEYQRLRKFMKGETATVKGAKQFKKTTDEELAKRFGKEEDFFTSMDEEEQYDFWSMFNDMVPEANARAISASDLADIVHNAMAEFEDRAEAREYIREELNSIYEEKKAERRAARQRYRNARSNRM